MYQLYPFVEGPYAFNLSIPFAQQSIVQFMGITFLTTWNIYLVVLAFPRFKMLTISVFFIL